jgi:hypothetical protein
LTDEIHQVLREEFDADGSQSVIIDSVFSNIMGGRASAVAVSKSSLILGSNTIGELLITENSTLSGATIHTRNNAKVQIYGATFTRNSGRASSCLAVVRESFAEMHNSQFLNNEGHEGGVFYVNERSGLNVKNSIFIGNKAKNASILLATENRPNDIIIS